MRIRETPPNPPPTVMPTEPAAEASSAIVKHSLAIAGHRTSVSLERAFWEGLKQIAADRGQSLAALVATIDAERGEANLSSAIRVFVLKGARASR